MKARFAQLCSTLAMALFFLALDMAALGVFYLFCRFVIPCPFGQGFLPAAVFALFVFRAVDEARRQRGKAEPEQE